jgi:hypothetical protein
MLLCYTVTQPIKQVQHRLVIYRLLQCLLQLLPPDQIINSLPVMYTYSRTDLNECNQVLSALTLGLYCRVRVCVTVSTRH